MSEKLPPLRIGSLESESPLFLGAMSTNLTNSALGGEVARLGYGTLAGVGGGMKEGLVSQKDYFEGNATVLHQEILDALEVSNNGNVGVNLMVAVTDYENMVKVAVESGAKFITSGAGLPLVLPELAHKYLRPGQKMPELIPMTSNVRGAELILRRWKRVGAIPSAFIVETPNDAGGHLGVTKFEDIGNEEYSLEYVVPNLVKKLDEYSDEVEYRTGVRPEIPVIVAGGIWDHEDMVKMLSPEIGAKGVQMSTRFLTTDECNASEDFKNTHLDDKYPVEIIKSPVGMPGRVLVTDLVQRLMVGEEIDLGPCVNCLRVCEHRESRKLKNQGKIEKLTSFCIIRALDNARIGDVDNGIFFTGTNSHRLKEDRKAKIHTARKVVEAVTLGKTA